MCHGIAKGRSLGSLAHALHKVRVLHYPNGGHACATRDMCEGRNQVFPCAANIDVLYWYLGVSSDKLTFLSRVSLRQARGVVHVGAASLLKQ